MKHYFIARLLESFLMCSQLNCV